jgi:hypothetical protein
MTDIEMTRLCAEAMGYSVIATPGEFNAAPTALLVDELQTSYDPLHNDGQAMALVKQMNLSITRGGEATDSPWWKVSSALLMRSRTSNDLNRAIVEAVAKMRKAAQ